ncbi:Tfp pilus assembly protein PilE [Streptosporangium saharense]|uniref:Tfp pilus assembly protein PilE n=1 Tax=Streptosporangium saharense TaxID=1706840 RepID=A0A7W7QMQ0_9ACTN|nr:Tfp pilus assembly protein PilE [Streptosporangium saharense]
MIRRVLSVLGIVAVLLMVAGPAHSANVIRSPQVAAR